MIATRTVDRIEARAQAFARLLAESAMDERDIVLSSLHLDELRPLVDADIGEGSWSLDGTTPAGLYNYEDTGMTTGGFLAAQTLRYMVTGEADARRFADRAFRGICAIYEIGRRKQAGYFPKPYNARISDQISRDQYLFAMHGMIAYHAIADRPVQRRIVDMICRMADYWMDIDYTHLYYNLPAASHLTDYEASLFLGIIGAAHRISGEARYRREYDRLFHEQRLGPRMPETLTDMFLRGQTHDGGAYYRGAEHTMMMKAIAIDGLWDDDAAHHDLWRTALRRFWSHDLRMGLDRESGMTYFIVGFDPRTRRPFLTEPGEIREIENPLNLANLTWGGLRQTAGSAQVAYVSAVIADRLKSREARELAWEILGKLDLEKFRGWTAPGPEHLPPRHEWQTKVLNTGYLAYWQWAYWLGRHRKLW